MAGGGGAVAAARAVSGPAGQVRAGSWAKCNDPGAANIRLGRNVAIDDNVVLDAQGGGFDRAGRRGDLAQHDSAGPGRLAIGAGSDIGANCLLATDSRLEDQERGADCGVCVRHGRRHHRYDDVSRPIIQQGFERKGGVRIGDDVWIGAHSTVLDGVAIGSGCVVGAHSLVNHSLDDRGVAAERAGGPAARSRRARGAMTSRRFIRVGSDRTMTAIPPDAPFLSIGFSAQELCTRCGSCAGVCPEDAIELDERKFPRLIPDRCTRCRLCAAVCPGAEVRFGELSSRCSAGGTGAGDSTGRWRRPTWDTRRTTACGRGARAAGWRRRCCGISAAHRRGGRRPGGADEPRAALGGRAVCGDDLRGAARQPGIALCDHPDEWALAGAAPASREAGGGDPALPDARVPPAARGRSGWPGASRRWSGCFAAGRWSRCWREMLAVRGIRRRGGGGFQVSRRGLAGRCRRC